MVLGFNVALHSFGIHVGGAGTKVEAVSSQGRGKTRSAAHERGRMARGSNGVERNTSSAPQTETTLSENVTAKLLEVSFKFLSNAKLCVTYNGFRSG
jgi:hypothetical protein